MAVPLIVGRRAIVPASDLLETLGESLDRIRKDDKLTLLDVAAVLGKSDDQAGKYCNGTADMGVVSFLRGVQAWNGRFANKTLALIGSKVGTLTPGEGSERRIQTIVARFQLELSIALEDEDLSPEEFERLQPLLDAMDAAGDSLRAKFKLASVK